MNIIYYPIFGFFYLISLLPLWILYLLSDLLFFPLYYVVRYRRKIVRKNLTGSFPEKSISEIQSIEKKFYSFLCDYFVETIKLISIRENNIRQRMVFKGAETINDYLSKGTSCAVYLGHYGNWEWISSLALQLNQDSIRGQVYHTLESQIFNKLFLYLRGRTGATSIAMGEVLRKIITFRKAEKRMTIGFISDQVPTWENIHHWINFLNHHDTPVLTGVERIIKQANFAVFYGDVKRIKRGYYVCEFKLLTDTPNQYPDFRITEMYFNSLEQTIRENPPYWLWTHNRWKRTREEYIRRFGPILPPNNP